MNYLFSGKVSNILNDNYLKIGSKAFYVNQEYLCNYYDKKCQRLNFLYYYAYLDCLVYFTYIHLFNLKRPFRRTGIPMYWYNSVSAQKWIDFDQDMISQGINPVDYLSSCFSTFYYQYAKYHRIYNYHIDELENLSSRRKYYQHSLHNPSWFHYYYFGNPLLDIVSKICSYRMVSEKSCLKDFVREVEFNWVSYLMNCKRLLRMPKMQFKMYFRHSRTEREDKLINSGDWLDIIKLMGVPDDAQAFGFSSKRLWRFTNGYHNNLLGLEEYYRNILEIKPYKLYSVDVAQRELNNTTILVPYELCCYKKLS